MRDTSFDVPLYLSLEGCGFFTGNAEYCHKTLQISSIWGQGRSPLPVSPQCDRCYNLDRLANSLEESAMLQELDPRRKREVNFEVLIGA